MTRYSAVKSSTGATPSPYAGIQRSVETNGSRGERVVNLRNGGGISDIELAEKSLDEGDSRIGSFEKGWAR